MSWEMFYFCRKCDHEYQTRHSAICHSDPCPKCGHTERYQTYYERVGRWESVETLRPWWKLWGRKVHRFRVWRDEGEHKNPLSFDYDPLRESLR